jgi:Xaa-Pro aminopeptidase
VPEATLLQVDANPVDVDRLRADRRRRLFAAMEAAGVDVLVLGRPAHVAFASGSRQLWTAGTRPFGPACTVVASTQRVHLLSTWDDGVPAEIGHDELLGLSWNPATLIGGWGATPGLADARRVATDGMAPGFQLAVQAFAPNAEIVDAGPLLRAAADVKSPDEVACIATATAIAEGSMAAMVAALRPGVTERDLLGVHLEHLSRAGVPAPPTEAVACVVDAGARGPSHLPDDRPIRAGDAVALDPGARFLGYEGGLGRTWIAGDESPTAEQRERAARCTAATAAVVAACRPGATGADLVAAWRSAAGALPALPIVHGLGLGMEPPVIGEGLGRDEVLREGMVLAVVGWTGHLLRDVVLVEGDGARPISRYRRMDEEVA